MNLLIVLLGGASESDVSTKGITQQESVFDCRLAEIGGEKIFSLEVASESPTCAKAAEIICERIVGAAVGS